MPMRVMPICTVERKPVGSSVSFSARAAPRLPDLAMVSSRARRAETMASSDMAKKPLSTTSTSTMTMDMSMRSPVSARRPAYGMPAAMHAGMPAMGGSTPPDQAGQSAMMASAKALPTR